MLKMERAKGIEPSYAAREAVHGSAAIQDCALAGAPLFSSLLAPKDSTRTHRPAPGRPANHFLAVRQRTAHGSISGTTNPSALYERYRTRAKLGQEKASKLINWQRLISLRESWEKSWYGVWYERTHRDLDCANVLILL